MQWSQFLPAVRKDYQGSKVAFYFLVFIAVVSTIRSLIHMFAADGGANSIAGIVIDVEGGVNIVAMFGQWGASQLILSVFYWLAILRYRFLTPFMLAMVLLEQILRIGVGELKPMQIAAPPPGAIASQLLLPLSAIMLILSLWRPGMTFGNIRGKA